MEPLPTWKCTCDHLLDSPFLCNIYVVNFFLTYLSVYAVNFFLTYLSFAFVRFDRGDRMVEEGSAQHANSISECIYGVSTQYAYTHMGYMEEEYLGCLRSIRMDME